LLVSLLLLPTGFNCVNGFIHLLLSAPHARARSRFRRAGFSACGPLTVIALGEAQLVPDLGVIRPGVNGPAEIIHGVGQFLAAFASRPSLYSASAERGAAGARARLPSNAWAATCHQKLQSGLIGSPRDPISTELRPLRPSLRSL
jgi:hypothetical protein